MSLLIHSQYLPFSLQTSYRYEDLKENRKQWWKHITDVQVAILVEMESIAERMVVVSREGRNRNDKSGENPDEEAEARKYFPFETICQNSNRGEQFTRDLIPYLVEMISESLEDPLEERLRCVRM